MPKNDTPAFLFYVDDFSADGKVEAMTTEQVGAYILLLCKAWRENPVGTLPKDDKVLSRWARLTLEDWEKNKSAVMAPFTEGADSRWHQKRMRQEFAKLQAQRKNRIEKAKKGGEATKNKWIKFNSLKATSVLQACYEPACSVPRAIENENEFFLTNSENSTENNEPKKQDASIEGEFETRWMRWPAHGRKEKSKCLRKWKARMSGLKNAQREFLLSRIDAGIEKWLSSQEFASGFVHSFERFLNNNRWEESPRSATDVSVVGPPSKMQKTMEVYLARRERDA